MVILTVMDDPMQLGRGITLPLREVTIRTSRSSGPGGQHANVTASRVEAILDVSASSLADEHKRRVIARYGPRVTATAQDARSQARNRELALERLQRRLSGALKPRRRRLATQPTPASVRRRLQGKRRQAERKRQRRTPTGEE
jgi:ribosome-associated protein